MTTGKTLLYTLQAKMMRANQLYSTPTQPIPERMARNTSQQWPEYAYGITIVTKNKSYINDLAYSSYKAICEPGEKYAKTYHTKIKNPTDHKAPTSYKNAGNREQQWFEAEDKERDGMLEFNT